MRTNQHTRKIWLNAKLQNISYPMLARGILVNCQFLLLLKASFSCDALKKKKNLRFKPQNDKRQWIYEISNTEKWMEHSEKKQIVAVMYATLSIGKKRPEFNYWDLKGVWTHDFCDIGAVLYQLSYQANWDREDRDAKTRWNRSENPPKSKKHNLNK